MKINITKENNIDLKVRAVRDKYETESHYIVIDNFKNNMTRYLFGVKVYENKLADENNDWIRGEKIKHPILEETVYKEKDDIEELPNTEMYLVLAQVLKENGYTFNKKTRNIITKKK